MIKSVKALMIDAYNLLYALESRQMLETKFGSLEEKRDALLNLVLAYQSIREVNISLVFDSKEKQLLYPQRTKVGRVEMIFTDETQSADHYIRERCEKKPGNFIVVSNDREVQRFAQHNQTTYVSSDEFIKKIKAAQTEIYSGVAPEEDNLPLYPKISTTKKGSPRKLPKKERRKKKDLKKL